MIPVIRLPTETVSGRHGPSLAHQAARRQEFTVSWRNSDPVASRGWKPSEAPTRFIFCKKIFQS